MFGWLRRNKPKKYDTARQDTATWMVFTYIALLQTYPHHFMDTSWLPADKQTMTELFKLFWLEANNEFRKKAENWWRLLARFQSGVGEMPMSFEILKDNPTVREFYEREAQSREMAKPSYCRG